MSNIKVKIKGKNINNYIKWLLKQKIDIIKMDLISHNELNLITNNNNYNLLKKYSKTYKISIIKKYGKLRIIEIIKKNIIIIISIIISIYFLYFLSNIVFSIDIISNDEEMIQILEKELIKYKIQKYRFKKEQKELEKIKDKILEDNKDTIEWLEITESGTKYIVKFVERKLNPEKSKYDYQSITASKDAIILDIRAHTGEKLKNNHEYISKNEVAISGILEASDGTKLYTKATGYIYGEVWYKVEIEYPYTYYEERVTGKSKTTGVLKFLNHKLSIFPYKKYKVFQTKEKVLVKDLLNIFKLSLEKKYEVIVTEDIYTEDEVISKAINKAKEKLLENNNKILEIKDIKIINKTNLGSKIKLNIFFTVKEDITKIIEVKKEEIS